MTYIDTPEEKHEFIYIFVIPKLYVYISDLNKLKNYKYNFKCTNIIDMHPYYDRKHIL